MAINTLEKAALFQKSLDLLAVQELTTGWMDKNAGQVKYSGGKEVKIPKMELDLFSTTVFHLAGILVHPACSQFLYRQKIQRFLEQGSFF